MRFFQIAGFAAAIALCAPAAMAQAPYGPASLDFQAADQLFLRGDPEQALSRLAPFMTANPNSMEGLYLRAAIQMELENYEQALADSHRAALLGPDRNWVSGTEFMALIRLRRYPELLDATDRIRRATTSTASQGVRICALAGVRRYDDMVRELDAFLANPFAGGEIMCPMGDLKDILDAGTAEDRARLSTALDAQPQSAAAHLLAGYLVDGTDMPKALAQYDEAVRLKPDWVLPRSLRARVNLELKAYAAALADTELLIQKSPTDPDLFELRGDIYGGMGDGPKAGASYDEAIRLMDERAGRSAS